MRWQLAKYEANRCSGNGDDSHDSRTGRRRQVPTTRECTYSDFQKCQPLNFKGTKGVVHLTQWLKKIESVHHITNCIVANQIKFATCTLLRNALTWWNSYESDEVEKYVGRLLNNIQGSVMASKPKTMQDAIEIANELMDQKVRAYAERQAENKRKLDNNNQAQQQPLKKQSVAIAYTTGSGERKGYAGTLPL
ncbi:hypothetical protein Tco_0011374 [Tanacetum coccineum]